MITATLYHAYNGQDQLIEVASVIPIKAGARKTMQELVDTNVVTLPGQYVMIRTGDGRPPSVFLFTVKEPAPTPRLELV